MPTDERTITLSVAEWNVVLAALGLSNAIVGKITRQAADQEQIPAATLMNGPEDRQTETRD